eukprot:3606160-Pleurochrysis_carterae.AAC.4
MGVGYQILSELSGLRSWCQLQQSKELSKRRKRRADMNTSHLALTLRAHRTAPFLSRTWTLKVICKCGRAVELQAVDDKRA